jgi:putative ATP-dependent endonuclease of OLD family
MHIEKIVIKNFKCFDGFELDLKRGINIIVGDNEVGKSTIIEAIHLALNGILSGKYLKNELTEYLFNKSTLEKWKKDKIDLPEILIEIYINNDVQSDKISLTKGKNNSKHEDKYGLYFKVCFDKEYEQPYQEYLKSPDSDMLPIEYYHVVWKSFGDDTMVTRNIPIKSILIDSVGSRYPSGSDMYINKIVRELSEVDNISILQAHRKLQKAFCDEQSIRNINAKINDRSDKISNKTVTLNINLKTQNAWADDLLTYVDDVPFHHIGKGEQCLIKTDLSLNGKGKGADIILLEEPENHLSHSKLNNLISCIEKSNSQKQIIISTHSSFVANKLNLENLILINKTESGERKYCRLTDLDPKTFIFFQKLPGYDTLRMLLCKSAILVEGGSDELIVQKTYLTQHNSLPIKDEIEVISVGGTTFLKFLKIADKVKKCVAVVTDNDGNIDAVNRKYENYLGSNKKDNIGIFYGKIKEDYTLEACIVNADEGNVKLLNKIFYGDENKKTKDELISFMTNKNNKTNCALKISDTDEKITFPKYILEAISHVRDGK